MGKGGGLYVWGDYKYMYSPESVKLMSTVLKFLKFFSIKYL